MQKLFKKILLTLSAVQVRKYKPMIIGITGNAGKTSTREAIAAVVCAQKNVRVAAGSLNNEFGFALTILGNWDNEYFEDGSSFILWLRVFFAGLAGLFVRKNFPEVFILEYGADRPGDIKKLAQAIKPHIVAVTTVGQTPVHVEYFRNTEELALEKECLVKILSSTDYAILNQDDSRVLEMKSKTKALVMTYGFGEGSTIRVSDVEYLSDVEGHLLGATFKLNKGSTFVPVRVEGSLGKSQAWSAAAAAAAGTVLGMNLVEISEALRGYKGPKGRLKIIPGIKNSHIIDDTYNASPASTRLALETLRDVTGLRKIAVLGDMLELGDYTISAHEEVGRFVLEIADVLICVGARAKFIAAAKDNRQGLSNQALPIILTFETSNDAKLKVQELIREHDIILVKGSQGMRMERIVAEIIAEPAHKKDLLVRQSQRWLREK